MTNLREQQAYEEDLRQCEPAMPKLELSDRFRNIIKQLNIIEDDLCNTIGLIQGNTPSPEPVNEEPYCHLDAIRIIENRINILCNLSRGVYTVLR